MKVKYVGGIGPVEIAGTDAVADNGETVEVDDQLGKSLIEQSVWEEVGKKPESKKGDR